MSKKKSFLLRIPPEIHGALHKWADDELRSLNGQIEYILVRELKRTGRLPKRRLERSDLEGEKPSENDPTS